MMLDGKDIEGDDDDSSLESSGGTVVANGFPEPPQNVTECAECGGNTHGSQCANEVESLIISSRQNNTQCLPNSIF
jgi:hypothetical protein